VNILVFTPTSIFLISKNLFKIFFKKVEFEYTTFRGYKVFVTKPHFLGRIIIFILERVGRLPVKEFNEDRIL